MNAVGSHQQLVDRTHSVEEVEHKNLPKGASLAVGGCLLMLLVCGFLYWASEQVKQPTKQMSKPPIEKLNQQSQLVQLKAATVKPLGMQKVNLPAPPKPQEQVGKAPAARLKAPAARLEAPKKPEAKSKAKLKTKPKNELGKSQPKKVVAKAQTKPMTKPAAKVIDVSKHQSRSSEYLLQQAEMGDGPSIDINWPSEANQRSALFSTFVDCLGVGLGVLLNGSVTPIHDSGREYSRLVRMVGGKMVEREARLHRQSGINGIAVRLFPRHVDSRLLAGFASIAQLPLSQYSQVQGIYVLSDNSLWVKNIYFDGKLSQGQILLARSACRR